jgi:hypothetical protein
MLSFGVWYQNWKKKTMVTDEDFEQTNANRHEYALYKSARGRVIIIVCLGYASTGMAAIISILTFGGPSFGAYIKSAIMLYWFIFAFSFLYRTEEMYLIDRLNSYRIPRTSGTARRKWFLFVRRRILVGLIYTGLLLVVWWFKL